MENRCIDKDHDALYSRKIFKFDGLYGNAFLIVMLPLLFLSIGVRECFHGDYFGALALVAAACFFLTLGYFQILVKADIIVDNEWISRFAFGRLIQRIRWSNVKLIKIFGQFGGLGVGYNIYPIENRNSGLGFNRKLAFGDGMRNPDEFINIMNACIAKYNIKIESVAGGVKTILSRLPSIEGVNSKKIDLSKIDL